MQSQSGSRRSPFYKRTERLIVDRDSYCGFVVIRKSFAAANRVAVVRMLQAYSEAFLFVSQNRRQTDEWFSEASGIDLDLITHVQSVESSLAARQISDIDLKVDDARVAKAQQVADTMVRLNLIQRPLKIIDRVDPSLYDEALQGLRNGGGRTSRVHSR